jgi:hypothetical protein
MRQILGVLLTLGMLLGSATVAKAVCGDQAGDADAVASLEAAVVAQCSCCSPRRTFRACVAAVMKTAFHAQAIPGRCMGPVRRDVIHTCPLQPTTEPCRVCNADADCAVGEFCECRVGSCAKTGGICVARPAICPDVVTPVCGCDGVTYGNDCLREQAGACKLHNGACTATGGCFDTIARTCTGQSCSPTSGCPLPNQFCSPACSSPPPTGRCFDTLARKCTAETCDPGHPCLPNEFCVPTCPPPPPSGRCFVTVENQCSTEPCGPGAPCVNPNEFCSPQCLASTTTTITLATTTTTTTLPTGGCKTDADCNDGNACTADHCVNGVCDHACVCLDSTGAVSCCPGPAALCVQSCGLDASGVCGGPCPTATDVCTPSATGCTCMPAPPACGDTFPTCGGSCAAGTLCATDTSTCHCVPEGPPSCGDSFPACGGTCPVGTTCTGLTGAPACQCVPAACQPGSGTFFYTCGDPVCSGHRIQPGVPPCSATQVVGAACTCLGQECDPGDVCNRLLECATSDPTHGGVCPL